MNSPPRGEIWLVDLGLVAKVRPCLLLSVQIADSERAVVCLVPHTTSARGTRFEVPVHVRFLRPGAFDAQGLASVPLIRLLRKLGELRPPQITMVEAAVLLWIGLKQSV